jgi:hypothetical protein
MSLLVGLAGMMTSNNGQIGALSIERIYKMYIKCICINQWSLLHVKTVLTIYK